MAYATRVARLCVTDSAVKHIQAVWSVSHRHPLSRVHDTATPASLLRQKRRSDVVRDVRQWVGTSRVA